ncbi:MAG: hypothetical protein M1814_001693 [Vezdaea aestivalis]|nr:MAG: hypothetical protein M1814_001693 [Vezdaea aestivalis]
MRRFKGFFATNTSTGSSDEGKPADFGFDPPTAPRQPSPVPSPPPPSPISRWMRRHGPCQWTLLTILLLVAGIIIVSLGLGLGLGLGLRPKPSIDEPTRASGSANLTGLVALDDGQKISKIFAYYLDSFQSIRRINFANSDWSREDAKETINVGPDGVRDASSLMALSYIVNSQLVWKVFFFDKKNILQESTYDNSTAKWIVGPLGNRQVSSSDSKSAGLTACYSEVFGDNYTPGISLFYGTPAGVQQLTFTIGNAAWKDGTFFPDLSGETGNECTSRNKSVLNLWGTSRDIVQVNGKPTRSLIHKYIELNDSVRARPTKKWLNSNVTYPALHYKSALSVITLEGAALRLVHVQLPNATIRELLVDGYAETSKLTGQFFDVKGANPRLETKLGTVIQETGVEDGREIHVLFEPDLSITPTKGNDGPKGSFVGRISDAVRSLNSNQWALTLVPIS